MNVKYFIKNIQKKPIAYVHEVKTDYLEYLIDGFICCNLMYDRVDNEERYFHCYFVDWIVEWINKNIDNKYKRRSSLWHQILRDVTNDEQEAVALFFNYVTNFLNNMKKIFQSKSLQCIYYFLVQRCLNNSEKQCLIFVTGQGGGRRQCGGIVD